jgi:hypothetical protein
MSVKKVKRAKRQRKVAVPAEPVAEAAVRPRVPSDTPGHRRVPRDPSARADRSAENDPSA